MNRATAVQRRFYDRQPSPRLATVSDGYRVASEILVAVADLGCSGDIYDYVHSVMERERVATEGQGAPA